MQGGEEGTPVSRLQVLEALLSAGYSLQPYRDVTVREGTGWARRYEQFNPLTDDPHMQLATDAG